jgi:hypothetical protein
MGRKDVSLTLNASPKAKSESQPYCRLDHTFASQRYSVWAKQSYSIKFDSSRSDLVKTDLVALSQRGFLQCKKWNDVLSASRKGRFAAKPSYSHCLLSRSIVETPSILLMPKAGLFLHLSHAELNVAKQR